MNNIKKQFPIFEKNPELAYFDNGATTLKPQRVLEKMNEYYTEYSANIHRGIYPISEKATEEYEKAREKVARMIGVETEEVVFTRGTTESLNMVARGWEKYLNKGDEIVTTVEEHHANLIPWQELAQRKGLELRFMGIKDYELEVGEIDKLISPKTKILAISQMSNVLGRLNPIKEIVARAREINREVVVVVDGAQAVAHVQVEMKDLDVDFYAFSGHKMYGPTGIGVLFGKKERLEKLEPSNYGGGMIREVTLEKATFADLPEKFEGGTPPIAEAIGLGEAVDFLESFRKNDEKVISRLIREGLQERKWIRMVGGGDNLMSIDIDGVHPHDVAAILARDGVAVRAGHHCAMPLHTLLEIEATTRISVGVYNDESDVRKLLGALDKVWTIFIKK